MSTLYEDTRVKKSKGDLLLEGALYCDRLKKGYWQEDVLTLFKDIDGAKEPSQENKVDCEILSFITIKLNA